MEISNSVLCSDCGTPAYPIYISCRGECRHDSYWYIDKYDRTRNIDILFCPNCGKVFGIDNSELNFKEEH